jgi:xylan 1,4-beta-xylosidase
LLFAPRAYGGIEVVIEVDARAKATPLKPIWAFFGYDEANYTTTPEGTELLETLAAIHDAQVRTRTHFLFNTDEGEPSMKWGSTNIYSEDSDGNPVYDFTKIDSIIDTTVEAGVAPLFELGFMPKALSSRPDPYRNSGTFVLDGGSFYPPKDYEKWAGLVAAWAAHAKDRHEDSQTNWIWELWNEPDIGYWQGTPEEFHRLYDFTEAALHSVLPDALLGAPAVASPEREFLGEFLAHCASGENAVTGEVGTRLDRVTFHAKGGVTQVDGHVRLDLGSQLRLHRMGFETVLDSPFAETPIIISEADPDGCAACPSSRHRYLDYRNSPAYGAYEVAMMKRSLELARDMGVELEGIVTWAFTFPDTPYFAGYRALATRGIHLPVLGAFKLLGALRGGSVPVASTGAKTLSSLLEDGVREEPEVDAWAALDENELRVLLFHYHDDLVEAEPATVRLQVSLPKAFGERVTLSEKRVDDTYGNAFATWKAQGSPVTPSDEQLEALHAAANSLDVGSPRTLEVEGGVATIELELPRFGLALLTLKKAAPEPLRDAAGCACDVGPQSPKGTPWLALALLCLGVTARLSRNYLN